MYNQTGAVVDPRLAPTDVSGVCDECETGPERRRRWLPGAPLPRRHDRLLHAHFGWGRHGDLSPLVQGERRPAGALGMLLRSGGRELPGARPRRNPRSGRAALRRVAIPDRAPALTTTSP